MENKMKMLDKWLSDLCCGQFGKFVKVIEDTDSVKGPTEHKKIVNIFTNDHKYHIVAIDRGNGRSYLGCQASTRKSLAGEDWFRGNDLPDGPFNRKTWISILNGIVEYELIPLASPVVYKVDSVIEEGPSLGENSEDTVTVGP